MVSSSASHTSILVSSRQPLMIWWPVRTNVSSPSFRTNRRSPSTLSLIRRRSCLVSSLVSMRQIRAQGPRSLTPMCPQFIPQNGIKHPKTQLGTTPITGVSSRWLGRVVSCLREQAPTEATRARPERDSQGDAGQDHRQVRGASAARAAGRPREEPSSRRPVEAGGVQRGQGAGREAQRSEAKGDREEGRNVSMVEQARRLAPHGRQGFLELSQEIALDLHEIVV